MKTLLKQFMFGFVCTIICISCNDIVNGSDNLKSYPIDVAATDFALSTGANWQNMQHDSVYRIDSQQELIQYLSSTTKLPEIDFDQYSLVMRIKG